VVSWKVDCNNDLLDKMPCSLWQKMRIVGYFLLNSSTLNELGSWCLKVWWIGEVIVSEEGGIHGNLASSQ